MIEFFCFVFIFNVSKDGSKVKKFDYINLFDVIKSVVKIGKFMVIKVGVSSWCRLCRIMDKNVFGNVEFQKCFVKNVIFVIISVDSLK